LYFWRRHFDGIDEVLSRVSRQRYGGRTKLTAPRMVHRCISSSPEVQTFIQSAMQQRPVSCSTTFLHVLCSRHQQTFSSPDMS
jgi:hypothetical protein